MYFRPSQSWINNTSDIKKLTYSGLFKRDATKLT